MKAAFGVYKYKDEYYVFPGEFGHAPFIAIVDLDTGNILEIKDNPYKAYEGRGKFKKMAEVVGDVNFIVAGEFGEDANKMIQMFNIIPVVMKHMKLEEAIGKVRENMDKIREARQVVSV